MDSDTIRLREPLPSGAPERLGPCRIIRKLGAGGMSTVFEAVILEDRTYASAGTHVAVKLVHPGLALDPGTLQRFHREGRFGETLSHPAIVRVFEALEEPAGPATLHFLVQEYADGRTLREILREEGRIPEPRLRDLGRRIAEGLAAVHAAGAVHRDVKPENLLVTPDAEVKILDLGAAHLADPEGRLTMTGEFLGSPLYAAPEQAEGGPVGPAADLYALGVVLFEAATGVHPFRADTTRGVLRRQVEDVPPPLRSLAPELSPFFERAVACLLEKDPGHRFAGAADLAEALASGDLSAVPVRPRESRWIVPVSLVLGTALAAAAVLVAVLGRMNEADAALPPRPAIAILGFENAGGDPETDWVSTALGELLAAELSAVPDIRITPPDEVARARKETGLAEGALPEGAALRALGSNLSTDVLVCGSFAAGEEGGIRRIRLDARMVGARDGRTIVEASETHGFGDLTALAARVGARFLRGIGKDAAGGPGGAASALPADPDAARLYSEGLDRLRDGDAVAARDRLEEAARSAPDDPRVHHALSRACSLLGRERKAIEEARRAHELSGHLDRADRLAIEARFRLVSGDAAAAAVLYGTLFDFFPDRIEYGIALLETGALPEPAFLEVLARLRNLPPPAGDDPRIDLAEAWMTGSHDPLIWREGAVRAGAKAQARGQWLLVASARLAEGWASLSLDDLPRSARAFEEAQDLGVRFDDRYATAWAILGLATVRHRQGDLAGAGLGFEEALTLCREVGNIHRTRSALTHLGGLRVEEGRLEEALAAIEEAADLSRELAHGEEHWDNRMIRAEFLAARGAIPEALAILRAQADEAQRLDYRLGNVNALIPLARVLLLAGRVEEARATWERAEGRSRDWGLRSGLADSHEGLAETLEAQGDLPGARARLGEALALREEIGERHLSTRTRLSIARLDLREGRAPEAEKAALEAASEFRARGGAPDEARAEALAATAALRAGDRGRARAAIDRAERALDRGRDFLARQDVTLARSRLSAFEPSGLREAERLALRAVEESTRAGYPSGRLQGLLVLAEIDLAQGRLEEAARRLPGAIAEARGAGLFLLEGDAAALLREARSQAGSPVPIQRPQAILP